MISNIEYIITTFLGVSYAQSFEKSVNFTFMF